MLFYFYKIWMIYTFILIFRWIFMYLFNILIINKVYYISWRRISISIVWPKIMIIKYIRKYLIFVKISLLRIFIKYFIKCVFKFLNVMKIIAWIMNISHLDKWLNIMRVYIFEYIRLWSWSCTWWCCKFILNLWLFICLIILKL